MRTVVLASSFKRAFKRLVGRQPQLQERIEERLALLTAAIHNHFRYATSGISCRSRFFWQS
ncbi:hypothetical protein [Nostoc sp.]|uniref:hypothetical protein n=1 Tax=Nostoc sp. TaxID=1180 RepID=UPI003FA60B09